jgi:hypothetical protein
VAAKGLGLRHVLRIRVPAALPHSPANSRGLRVSFHSPSIVRTVRTPSADTHTEIFWIESPGFSGTHAFFKHLGFAIDPAWGWEKTPLLPPAKKNAR